MQTLEDYIMSIKNRKGCKNVVRDSWGVYDAYKYIRKNGWYNIGRPVKEHEFYSIIRGINKYLATEIVNGNTVRFPYRMGKLELRKQERGVYFKNNKLRISYPINWNKTLKLWFEDEEARRDKTLVRMENKEVFKVYYNKYTADYNNQCFYDFSLNRSVKVALKENILNNKIDALW